MAEGLLVAIVSLLCAAWALRLWRADLAIPLRYSPVDDTKFYLMLAKGIAEHGSYLSNPTLGAPFGQHLSDYPQGADNLNLLMIRGLAVFSSNPALIVNLFYLLTFALAGFTSHVVLRSLRVGALAAGVCSVLFALLTYHFFRGESHLLLSAYYGVPLSLYLFLRLLEGAPSLAADSGPARRRPAWLSRRYLPILAVCLIVGSDNLYYATFTVVMLLAAVLLVATTRDRRAVLRGLVLIALIVTAVVANLSPSLLYRAEHGGNRELERSAAFTEMSDEAFSLRLANLILPEPNAHFAPLRSLAGRYDREIAPGYCEACYGNLGTVGSVGFLWLILGALGALLGAAGYYARNRLLRSAAVGVLIALAVGTIGGVASLIEVFVTPDIRAWNRISVFIAFLSLLAFALLLDRLRARSRSLRRGAALTGVACVAMLIFGVYDQTSDSFIPPYASTARTWRSDQRFVEHIERSFPAGAAVFQLPYVPFPEGYPETPVGDELATYATKYQPLRGYLHSSSLRWSYGAMKGRPEDWSASLAGQPLGYVVTGVTAVGFDGLWVDESAFESSKAQAVRTELLGLLGERPAVNTEQDLLFYDLRPYLARLQHSHTRTQLSRLRDQTLHPLRTVCESDGVLEVVNPSSFLRQATLTARLARASATMAKPLAPPPDGQAVDIPTPETVVVRRRLRLAPGPNRVQLATQSRVLGGTSQLLYATVADAGLASFAPVAESSSSASIPGLTGPPCGL